MTDYIFDVIAQHHKKLTKCCLINLGSEISKLIQTIQIFHYFIVRQIMSKNTILSRIFYRIIMSLNT